VHVLIVGAGPVGLMLAAELALAGVDVAIVERRASQEVDGSRSGGLHSRTIEVLDQRGIADRFLAAGQAMQIQSFAEVRLDISDFPTRHNYGLALWQSHFERILAAWVSELGVPIAREREVTGFTQDRTGVDVELSDGQPLRADYLVGCDGGRSVIRKAAGIEFPGWDPTVSWLIAEVKMDQEPEFGIRHGRVLLAGDAAHVHPPQGGQGLNTGVQDAVNLGWKLAQVVKGTSPDSLLDSYHAERHPVGARVQHNTLAQNALRGTDDPAGALHDTMTELLSMDEPRRRFAGMVSGLDICYDLGDGHPLLGRRMPDLDLVTADGPRRVFTWLHDARPVLLNLAEPGWFDITPWAARVQLVDASYDGTWQLPVLGEVTAPTAVLIRPDGHVAWVGDLTDLGLPDALTTWFGPRRPSP
jgi:2-polyprenyl-6-methoxyphenol hydroxylase-like FAD-dependent oxidoreductase